MSAQGPEATDDYSKSPRARTRAPGGLASLSAGAAGLGIAGAILAFIATFSTVIEIRVLTVTPASFDGMDRYGPALLVLGIFGLVMVAGAWRGARPAMGALALAGLAVLLIAILVDVPHLNDTGVWPMADQYEDATAGAGIGFYFETASGVLMLLSGVLMLLLGPRETQAPRGAREAAAPRTESPSRPGPATAPDDPPRPGTGDWFADTPVETRAQRLTEGQRPSPRRRGGLVDRLRRRDD